MKKTKIIHWSTTGIIALMMVFSALAYSGIALDFMCDWALNVKLAL